MTAIDPGLPGRAVAADPREAVLRPFARPGRVYWLIVAVLTAVVLIGLAAWIVQLRDGMGVAGYSDQAFWAIYIADVVTFIGVSYGGAVISAILRLTGAGWRAPLTRLAEGTAVVTVLIGAALIIPHLGRPERVWELVTRPNLSSPVFWDFVAVMTYTAASIVFFALPLVPDMAIVREGNPEHLGRLRRWLYAFISRGWVGSLRQRRVLSGSLGIISIMIIPLAVSVHSVLSWAFSLVNRPWWHESIWAPYFVVAALYSGVALVILVVAAFRRAYHLEAFITERHFVRLGFIMAAFAATYLYLTFADILPGAYVGDPGTATVFHELLAGRYALWFWLFFVGGGLLPLLFVALPWTRNVRGMVIAATLIIPAMWLKRMLMVVEPANYDRIDQVFGDFHFTWVSVSVTLAALAAIPLLLMLLFRVVPLLAIEEMKDMAGHEQPATDGAVDDAPSGRPARRGRGFRAAGGAALLVAAVGLVGLGAASPARAETPAKPAATVTITGQDSGGAVRLTATLTTADRRPLAKADVVFQQASKTFKQAPFVPIKSVRTDDSGVAQLTYKSILAGDQQFVAKYAGGSEAGSATASTTVNVQTAYSGYTPSSPNIMGSIGDVTVRVLIAIVVVVWLTLIGQVIRVRRACTSNADH